jgi:hypothetical protein
MSLATTTPDAESGRRLAGAPTRRSPVQLAACRVAGRVTPVILCLSATIASGSARSVQNAGSGARPDNAAGFHDRHSVRMSVFRANSSPDSAERRL